MEKDANKLTTSKAKLALIQDKIKRLTDKEKSLKEEISRLEKKTNG